MSWRGSPCSVTRSGELLRAGKGGVVCVNPYYYIYELCCDDHWQAIRYDTSICGSHSYTITFAFCPRLISQSHVELAHTKHVHEQARLSTSGGPISELVGRFCAPVCVLGRKSSHRGGCAAREREGGRGSSTEDLFLALALVDGLSDPAGGRASPMRAARGANDGDVTYVRV